MFLSIAQDVTTRASDGGEPPLPRLRWWLGGRGGPFRETDGNLLSVEDESRAARPLG
jgi:hypothetical protein